MREGIMENKDSLSGFIALILVYGMLGAVLSVPAIMSINVLFGTNIDVNPQTFTAMSFLFFALGITVTNE